MGDWVHLGLKPARQAGVDRMIGWSTGDQELLPLAGELTGYRSNKSSSVSLKMPVLVNSSVASL